MKVRSGWSEEDVHVKFEGTMLICIGTDAEDQLVPLAFAIVQKEDTDSWCWFLRLVKTSGNWSGM